MLVTVSAIVASKSIFSEFTMYSRDVKYHVLSSILK